ncbi:MAG: efflux RND transporter periplasmic adaptor subunit [Lachnospiraceae bacterium]|jgi:HlyD family secretion protein|nr:efflux RND transporter periplasmic adaptor subunit [Lachnospiraceae bacterium]
MKKKVLKIVVPAVVVVVIGGAMVLNGAVNAGKELEEAMRVEAMTVETGDVTEIVETNGTVVSGEQKVIFSPVNANVEVADFQVGDLVKAGEKLVTFGLKDLEEQNQKAELTVRANELGYQDAVNKSNEAANRQAEARTKAASLQNQVDAKIREVEYLTNVMTGQVNAQVVASQQEAERLNGEIGELQVQLETAQKEQEMAKEAYDQALSAQQTAQVNFEAAAAAAESDSEGLEAAKEALNKANKEAVETKAAYEKSQESVTALENQMESLKASFPRMEAEPGDSGLQQQLQTAQSELAELKANLEGQKAIAEGESGALSSAAREQMRTNNNLSELESKSLEELIEEGRKGICAEFNGVISDKQVLEGAMVTQGMQLFTLQSIDQVNVEVTLSKNVYDKVKEGQTAEITFAGQTYQGTVKRISRIASSGMSGTNQAAVSSASVMATVQINNPDENIFLGVDAKVKIFAAEAKDVLILPTEAVNIGKDGTFCWVNEDGIMKKRSITTGVTSDECAEITQGIDEGEQVIPDPGVHEEGDPITVIETQDETVIETEME